MPRGIYPHKTHSEETKRKMAEARKGHAVSSETRAKLSAAMKSKNIKPPGQAGRLWTEERKRQWSEQQKGKQGRKHSEETKRLLSEQRKGEKSSSWKGGATLPNKLARRGVKFADWRAKVFERDAYTCAKCQEKGGKLHPHHVQNFAEHPTLRYEVGNGVTLCEKCHIQFHKQFGKKGNNAAQLNEFVGCAAVEAQMALIESEQAELPEVFLPYMETNSGQLMYQNTVQHLALPAGKN